MALGRTDRSVLNAIVGVVSVEQVRVSTGLAKATVYCTITHLLKLKMIQRVAVGRYRHFKPEPVLVAAPKSSPILPPSTIAPISRARLMGGRA